VPDGTVIMAQYQNSGRGQMGNEWLSNPGENLMCSIVYRTNQLAATESFVISKIAAIAVKETLEEITDKTVHIKWPNDIYIESKKVCGMLIENQWQGNQLTTIIGIGINVNQTEFDNNIRATSCALVCGKSIEVKEVLKKLIQNIEHYYNWIRNKKHKDLDFMYKDNLLFFNESRSFKSQGETFSGTIKDVLNTGHLQIIKTNGQEKLFAFKEVEFIF
jgi:BirA family biotin operon repressor/biotin-[acetyl-CoA-carboxylase] ligase